MAEDLVLLIGVIVFLLVVAAAVEGLDRLHTAAARAVESWKGEGNAPLGVRAVLAVVWRRWLCGRVGHREDFNISFERVWISCSRCGWESRGVQLHPHKKAAQALARGDESSHGVSTDGNDRVTRQPA